MTPIVIVVRDPDAANTHHVFNGEVETYDIDAGYMDLDDLTEFGEWAVGHLAAAEAFDAEGRHEAADCIRDVVLSYTDTEQHQFAQMDSTALLAHLRAEGFG